MPIGLQLLTSFVLGDLPAALLFQVSHQCPLLLCDISLGLRVLQNKTDVPIVKSESIL